MSSRLSWGRGGGSQMLAIREPTQAEFLAGLLLTKKAKPEQVKPTIRHFSWEGVQ